MSTVVKDNFYVKYIGQSDEDLTHGEIYPVESIVAEKSYGGAGWPTLYFEFHPKLNLGAFNREVGDKDFVVVQDDFWLIQELGRLPEYGETVSYMGYTFPYSGIDMTLPIMKLFRFSACAQ